MPRPAFHPLNMGLLKASAVTGIQKVFGSTVGLSDAAVRSVKSALFTTFNKIQRTPAGNNVLEFDELNLEPKEAHVFLVEHFRGLA